MSGLLSLGWLVLTLGSSSLPPTDVPLPFYTSREWWEEDGGLGPPGARSGVKLPLRVAQEQTDIFCLRSLSSLLQCFSWLEDSWFGEMARHDISELALLQEKGAQGEVSGRKTSLQKVETCIELATDMH